MMIIVLGLKNETNSKSPPSKVGYRIRITKDKNIFNKGYTENWSRKIFVVDPVDLDPKYLNGEKIIGSFYEKNCCWVNYEWVIILNQIVKQIKSK